MSKRFDPNSYIDVAERIRRFYARHPEGRIVTTLESWGEQGVIFRAAVYRDRTQPLDMPDATGWAHEVPGDGMVNQTNPVENCETSAIGRALANLGFPVKAGEPRPSREEMESAERRRTNGQTYGAQKTDAKPATQKQMDLIDKLVLERQVPPDHLRRLQDRIANGPLTTKEASEIINWLSSLPKEEREAAPVGDAVEDDHDSELPF